MANRYWVGGTGTWSTTNTANWSATSGGASGASVPGVSDAVIFDSASATANYTVTRSSGLVNIASIAISAPATGSLSLSGSSSSTACVIQGTGQFDHMPGGGILYFGGSGSSTIVVNATTNNPITFGFTGTKTWTFSGTAATLPGLQFASSSSATLSFSTNPTFDSVDTSTSAAATLNFTGTASSFRVFGGVGGWNNAGTVTLTGNTVTGLYYGDNRTSGSGSGSAGTFALGTISPSTFTTYIDFVTTRNFGTVLSGTFYAMQILSYGSTSVIAGTATITTSFVMNTGATSGLNTVALTFTGTGAQTISCNGNTIGAITSSAKTAGSLDISTDVVLYNAGTCWTTAAACTITGSGIIIINSYISTVARTFAGAGKTYGGFRLTGSAVNITTITGSNTFGSMNNAKTAASTLTLTQGTTTTVTGTFDMSGSVGQLLTLNSSSAGTIAILSKSSGTVSVSYMSIKDISATGGAIWLALKTNGNVDGVNNLGWDFGPDISNMLLMFL